MASNAAVLNILITANSTQAQAQLMRTQKQLMATAAAGEGAGTAVGSKFAKAARIGTLAAIGLGVYGLGKASSKAADFEKQMDNVGAVLGANKTEMKKLSEQAIDLGAKTQFSAMEAAGAQEELAKGGLNTADILDGALGAALDLAAAGQLDLADASEATVNAMKLFDMPARKAMRVADMFAVAANTTTADVGDFALALKQGGAAAKQAGWDLGEAVLTLEALAEAGVRGSDAGTSMKAALLQLAAPTSKQANLAQELGLNFFTANGELKSAVGISKELRDGLEGMTKQQRTANLRVLAGTDGFRTLAALYDAGPKKLKRLEDANEKQGTAAKVAAEKNDNLRGDLEELGGAVESLQIKVGSKFNPVLRDTVQFLTDMLNKVGEIDLSGLGSQIDSFWSNVKSKVGGVDISVPVPGLDTGSGGKGWADQMAEDGGKIWSVAGPVVMSSLSKLKGAFELWAAGMVNTVTGLGSTVAGVLTLDFEKARDGVLRTLKGAAQGAIGIVAGLSAPFRGAAEQAGLAIWQGIGPAVRSVAPRVAGVVSDLWRAAMSRFTDVAPWIKKAVAGIPGAVLSVKGAVVSAAEAIWNAAKSVLSKPIQMFVKPPRKVSGVGADAVDSFGKSFGENASGTGFWRGGLTWVGENGPELINLARGAQVFPAGKSRRIARSISAMLDDSGVRARLAGRAAEEARLSSGYTNASAPWRSMSSDPVRARELRQEMKHDREIIREIKNLRADLKAVWADDRLRERFTDQALTRALGRVIGPELGDMSSLAGRV